MIRRLRILGFRGTGSSAIEIGGVKLPHSTRLGEMTPAAGRGGPRVSAVSGSVADGA